MKREIDFREGEQCVFEEEGKHGKTRLLCRILVLERMDQMICVCFGVEHVFEEPESGMHCPGDDYRTTSKMEDLGLNEGMWAIREPTPDELNEAAWAQQHQTEQPHGAEGECNSLTE